MNPNTSNQHSNDTDDLTDGLQEGHNSGGRFVSINNGRFVERVPEGTEGAIQRILQRGPNAGKPVWEKFYDVLTGRIEGMYNRVRTVDFGDGEKEAHSTVVILSVDGQRLNVEINANTRYWSWFVCSLPNIDLTRKVRLSPFDYTKRGSEKRTIGLGVTQAPTAAQKADPQVKLEKDGTVKVPWYWTKENPRGLPPVEEVVHPKTKKVEYYYDARDEYLRAVVERCGEKLKAQHEQSLATAEAAQEHAAADISNDAPNPFPAGDIVDDDTPF